jgi:hypothetical protein
MKKNRVVIILGIGLLLIIAAFIISKLEKSPAEEVVEPELKVVKKPAAAEPTKPPETNIEQQKFASSAADDEQHS